METVWKLVEILSNAAMWAIAIVLLSIAIFGGSINVEIRGLYDLVKWFK